MAALALALTARAEDYQCGAGEGNTCTARITEDGELKEVEFRNGDMVSTDAGWSVSTDDGWVKVKTGPRIGGRGKKPGLGFTIGEVMLWTPAGEFGQGVYAAKPPTTPKAFLRPLVSIASAPPQVCLIGL